MAMYIACFPGIFISFSKKPHDSCLYLGVK
jgi:hypothetical protein